MRTSFLLAITLLFIVTSTSADTPTLIDARIQPERPATLSGELHGRTTADFVAEWTPRTPGGNLVEANAATLTITETRSPVVVYASGTSVTGLDLGAPDGERALKDLQLRVESTRPDTRWILWGTNEHGVAATNATCTVAAVLDPGPRSYYGIPVSPAWQTDVVEARCLADSVAFQGGVRWIIWNTTLVLEYTDPSTGDRTTERLVTGELIEPSQTAPGTDERVRRVATLRLTPPHANGTWSGRSELVLQSPTLTAAGTLSVPPFMGQVQWGDVVLEREQVRPDPTGTFLFGADRDYLKVQGATANEPLVAKTALQGANVLLPVSAATLAGLVLALVLWRLFARIAPEDLLVHELRRAIFDFIRANPGTDRQTIMETTNCARSTFLHHTSQLMRGGLIARIRIGRHWAYVASADYPTPESKARVHAQLSPDDRLLEVLKQRPRAAQKELADALGLSQSYVSRLLKKLETAGRLAPEYGSRRRAHQAPDEPSSG